MDGTYMTPGEVAASQTRGEVGHLELRIKNLEEVIQDLIRKIQMLDGRTVGLVRLGGNRLG